MVMMHDAADCLSRCEGELRGLASRALDDADYAAVRHLTEIAETISHLKRQVAPADPTDPAAQPPESPTALDPASGDPPTDAKLRTRRITSKAKRAKAYPRFFRRGERLIKIGWSKKARKEYEHRAPRSAVDALVGRVRTHASPGRLFTVEDLLPVPDPATGGELPGYQIYIILAWLQRAGLVQKRGREGYVIQQGQLTNSAIKTDWESLAEIR